MKIKRKKKSASQSNTVRNTAMKILIGSVVGMVVFFVLSLLASLILWKNDSAPSAYGYVIIAIGALAGFVGGFTAVRPTRKNGIASGMLSAVLPCSVIFLTSVLIARGGVSVYGWIFLAVYILVSAVGGIVAVNKRK